MKKKPAKKIKGSPPKPVIVQMDGIKYGCPSLALCDLFADRDTGWAEFIVDLERKIIADDTGPAHSLRELVCLLYVDDEAYTPWLESLPAVEGPAPVPGTFITRKGKRKAKDDLTNVRTWLTHATNSGSSTLARYARDTGSWPYLHDVLRQRRLSLPLTSATGAVTPGTPMSPQYQAAYDGLVATAMALVAEWEQRDAGTWREDPTQPALATQQELDLGALKSPPTEGHSAKTIASKWADSALRSLGPIIELARVDAWFHGVDEDATEIEFRTQIQKRSFAQQPQ